MTDTLNPTSVRDPTIDAEDMTMAIVPKALGTRSRVNNMFRASRLVCSATLAPPTNTAPRVVLALRFSPRIKRSMYSLIEEYRRAKSIRFWELVGVINVFWGHPCANQNHGGSVAGGRLELKI